jgi:Arc/MetJ-type ribon-helix-helix transcriptional regulator
LAGVKTLRVELPDRLMEEASQMVREGWFGSENELVRMAVAEFLRNRRLELQERFQREDIAWAVAEAKPR